jgi:hypothetical protein
MPSIVIDLIFAGLILGMTWALMSEGLWGAALMFFNVVFGAIIALNFYEPLAAIVAKNIGFVSGFADMICLMTLFIVSVLLLRLTTESLAPTMVRFPTGVYHAGRVLFGFAGAVATIGFLVVACHTMPVHKKVFTVIDYKYKPPFGFGIDHKWLGFFQYTTGYTFPNYNSPTRDWMGEFGNAKIFDPKAEWLLNHEMVRPYGESTGIGGEGETSASESASAGGGGGGSRPGDIQVIGPAVGGGVVIPN